MTIAQATPEVSELTREQIIKIEEGAEYHHVPFGSLPVDAFKNDALIREAVALYWQPEYSVLDGTEGRDSALYSILYNVFPQGLEYRFSKKPDFSFLIEVRIILTYPLNEYWEATVKIPANRFGEVFAIAHDMYRHVYDLDDAQWQSQGHQDAAPRGGAGLMNRARGSHVWGHDMSDLVFESIGFLRNPDWPTIKRKIPFITKSQIAAELKSEKPEPEYETVLDPLEEAKHGSECPFVGTVIFGIGS